MVIWTHILNTQNYSFDVAHYVSVNDINLSRSNKQQPMANFILNLYSS